MAFARLVKQNKIAVVKRLVWNLLGESVDLLCEQESGRQYNQTAGRQKESNSLALKSTNKTPNVVE